MKGQQGWVILISAEFPMVEKVYMLGPTKWHFLLMSPNGLDWMGRKQNRPSWVEHRGRDGTSHNVYVYVY